MKITAVYSHLNGYEWLLVHQKALWKEIASVISSVDASTLQTKISKERRTKDKMFYSPAAMNKAFATQFNKLG